MISCYEHIKNPFVTKEIDIYEFIEQIKQPDQSVLDLINKARLCYGKSEYLYNFHKLKLPCFTLNFSFYNKKANENIKMPTGFIYLDLDNETDIDLKNELIFASWKSISNNGRGILVKVNGLSINNFRSTHISISKELKLEVDKQARKPTQSCFHSYDNDIYVNNNSITWECEENNIIDPPNKNTLLNKKKKDNVEEGEFSKLKFNNINDYDFNGKDFLYFEGEKEIIAEVFIPKRIEKGSRNNIISAIANQIKALNNAIAYDDFKRLIKSINYKSCKPPLKDIELNHIIIKTYDNEKNNLVFNKRKRFIFSPEKKLTHKEKMKIIAPIMGKRRSDKTIAEIKEALRNWDINKYGKITQKSLQKRTGKNIKTIEKYYYLFKNLIKSINKKLIYK